MGPKSEDFRHFDGRLLTKEVNLLLTSRMLSAYSSALIQDPNTTGLSEPFSLLKEASVLKINFSGNSAWVKFTSLGGNTKFQYH